MPDLDTLTDYIHLALEELEKAVAEIDGEESTNTNIQNVVIE